MFKKIKENENLAKIIELLKTPRYRSLVILGLYFIFFAFVFTFLKSIPETETPTNNNNNKQDILEQFKDINNYQYRLEITSDTNEIIIGKRYRDKQIIEYNNNTYYLSDNNLYILQDEQYQLTDNIMKYHFYQLSPDYIYKLIKLGTLDYETKYANDITIKSYLVPQEKFNNLNDINTPESDPIRITVSNDTNRITKVELDLTNIYDNAVKNNYIVKIEYEFIGQITPINIQVGGNNG